MYLLDDRIRKESRVLWPFERVSALGRVQASERDPRRLGATFLSRGLTAGAEAQTRPLLTSTELQIAMLEESPGSVSWLEIVMSSNTHTVGHHSVAILAV